MEVVAAADGHAASRTRTGIIAVLAGLTVIAILLALGFIFSGASNAQRVAQNAEALHEANAAVGSAALSRAAVAQAVVFGIDYTIHGVATRDARDQAVAAAEGTWRRPRYGPRCSLRMPKPKRSGPTSPHW